MIASIYLLAFAVALLVVTYISACFVYRKAERHWFEAIIPIWSSWAIGRAANEALAPTLLLVLTSAAAIGATSATTAGLIAEGNIIVYAIQILNVIVNFWTMKNLSKSFGHSIPYALGLTLLPFFFYVVLATSNDSYTGPQ